MTRSRYRLAALIVATMSLLAILTTAETQDLHVVPAAEASVDAPTIDSPQVICYRWRPHTGDTVEQAFAYHMDVFVVKIQCVADDPNYSGDHYYCVRVYSSGYESWSPGCLNGFG